MTLAALPALSSWRPRARADHSLAPMLAAVGHALHPALVAPTAHVRLERAMATVPDVLTTLFYLEARLGDDPAVDLILRVGPEGRRALLGGILPDSPPGWQGDAPAWAPVRALARAWADQRSALSARLHHLWLELDAGTVAADPARLVPGVFACFGELRGSDYTPQRWHAHALAALDPLLGGSPSAGVGDRLGECFDRLPANAYVPYVGMMLGREAESVRICVTGIAPDELAGYLHDIGWSADVDAIEALVSRLSSAQPAGPLRGAGMVHLDVAAAGVWRLGLEFACQRAPQLRGVLREIELVDALPALGLGSRAKCRALLDWPGSGVVRVPASNEQRVVLRRVNHVKLVFQPGRPPQAKAYLAARHFPRANLFFPPAGGAAAAETTGRDHS